MKRRTFLKATVAAVPLSIAAAPSPADRSKGAVRWAMGDDQFRLRTGESVFAPRKIDHVWACVSDKPGKMMNVFQPAGKMEAFFREIGKLTALPPEEEFQRLFRAHGMEIVGPPLPVK